MVENVFASALKGFGEQRIELRTKSSPSGLVSPLHPDLQLVVSRSIQGVAYFRYGEDGHRHENLCAP